MNPNTAALLDMLEPFIILVMVIYSSSRIGKMRTEVEKLHKDADNLAELIGTKTAKARQKAKAFAKLKGD